MGKLFTILKRSVAIIITSTMIGIMVIASINVFLNEYSDDTFVGNISLSGEEKSNARMVVLEGVASYVNDYRLVIEFNNKVYELSPDVIAYNLNETIDMISNGKSSPIVFTVNSQLLESELNSYIPSKFIDVLSIPDLERVIKVSLFENSPETYIRLSDFIEDMFVLSEPINTYTFNALDDLGQIENIQDFEIMIEPSSRFHFLQSIQDQFLNTEELSLLATGVTAVALETNFTSFMKSNHTILPTDEDNDYAHYDTYVNVAQGKDLSFFNPYDFPYKIMITKSATSVTFTLVGIPYDKEYIHKVVETEIEYLTGEGDVPAVGKNGVSYEVKRYIIRSGAEVLDETLYMNYYGPVKAVT